MKFPALKTKDLNGEQRILPDSFKGEINLLIVAYQQYHQAEVNTWVPLADQLEAQFPDFHYYELPVVGRMGPFGRMQLDFWMRQGIPSPTTRERTLTLYIDRAGFRQSLHIETEETIALLLLDRSDHVIWQGYGPYDESTVAELRRAVAQAYAIPA